MFKRFFTLLLPFAFSCVVFAADNVLPYKSDVVIDGLNKEWSSPLPKFDKTTGINYSIANDQANLYFIIRITDEAIQKEILQNGLEIWINKQGKRERVTGVAFPLPSKTSTTAVAGKPEQSSSSAVSGQGVLLNASELMLNGFLIDNGKQPTKGCPVRVALSKDSSDCLFYELAVPFNTFYKERLDQNDAKVKFSIAFVIKSAGSSSTTNAMATAMPVGYGMGGHEGMGMNVMREGGINVMRQMGMPTIIEKFFWIKTGLAVK